MEGLVMDQEFWKNRRVFLTGHTGFKGGWMSLWLQSMGADVTGYALAPPSDPNFFTAANVGNGMRSFHGDVRDLESLREAMRSAKPEIVIHMAAQPLVRYSYDHPLETYSTNVMGTVNLLEAARSIDSIRAIVNVTTDKCYQNLEWDWGYRENDRLGGYDCYSSSKACSELITSAYRSSFFKPTLADARPVGLATARAGNVIGGGDWATDRLIPDIFRAFTAGHVLQIRSPGAIRPWQFVLEPLGGYLILAQKLFKSPLEFSDAWNFGPAYEDVKPVEWLVQEISKDWGSPVKWGFDADKQPHEATYLKLDVSKAAARLGWRPGLRLENALAMTLQWHKQFLVGGDMNALSLDQINKYQEVLKSANHGNCRS
jgi:CDP-glucose 4,6-dehydratase